MCLSLSLCACLCVCVCVCVYVCVAGDGRERVQDVPLPLALYCRKAPIGVGHALFVLSDDQLTRIFTQPKTLCAVLSQIVCVCVCVCVCVATISLLFFFNGVLRILERIGSILGCTYKVISGHKK